MKYNSNSRENQDLFILSVLDKKKEGTYLEIGSATPIVDNNTYLLESEFNWTGVSIDFNYAFINDFNVRSNPFILADATELDYDLLISNHYKSTHIDYLQLDIDPPSNTFKALNKINFDKFSFSVITYEHDLYAGGEYEREASRKVLESYGYTRVISDVMHNNLIFEDWYVNEKYMPTDIWKQFIDNNVNLNTNSLNEKYQNLFNLL
jgi:hypothetical protein